MFVNVVSQRLFRFVACWLLLSVDRVSPTRPSGKLFTISAVETGPVRARKNGKHKVMA